MSQNKTTVNVFQGKDIEEAATKANAHFSSLSDHQLKSSHIVQDSAGVKIVTFTTTWE
ncbi:MAG: hypothetical protein ACLQF0_03400 [Dissulfurispiraceae bacterium]